MSTLLDADLYHSASHRAAVDHLTAPLAPGARTTTVAIDNAGIVAVDWATRLPLLLVAPRAGLTNESWRVTPTLDPGGAATPQPAVVFAPHTEQGALLPIRATGAPGVLTPPFRIGLTLTRAAGEGAGTAVPLPQLAGLLEVVVVEGVLGRLLYSLTSEKARMRRAAREIAAQRIVGTARRSGLDRLGAEVGVARFGDRLAFDAGNRIVAVPRREPDREYRRRLAPYRTWQVSTRNAVEDLLNGPGLDTDPNAGVLRDVGGGLTDRFSIQDEANELAVAIKLVAADAPTERQRFLEHLRAAHLIWPRDNQTADAVHGARRLADDERREQDELRRQLRLRYGFADSAATDPALAAGLAATLALVGRVRLALGVSDKLELTRLQQSDGGSRYELGLGADLTNPPAAQLNALRGAATDAQRSPTKDAQAEAVIAALRPVPPAEDPQGAWLLSACGLRTVHRVNATTTYVSHLPTFGLVVDGPADVGLGGWSLVVSGSYEFGEGAVYYDRTLGTARVVRVNYGGDIETLADHTGWRTSWRTIVFGQFSGRGNGDLAYYDGSNGDVAAYHVEDDGSITLLWSGNAGSASFTHVVAGSFLPFRAQWQLLFYDAATGAAELRGVDEDGLGQRVQLRLPAGWTHLVPGQFGFTAMQDQLLGYDAAAGVAEVWRFDKGASGRVVYRSDRWKRGWSVVCTGSFSESQTADLLLFDRRSGDALFLAWEDGQLVTLGRRPGWHKSVSLLAAVPLSPGDTRLLAYDRIAGENRFYVVDPGGKPAFTTAESSWPRSTPTELEARYQAERDTGTNAALAAALADATARWEARGGEAWTELGQAAARTLWQAAVSSNPAERVFAAAGVPARVSPGSVAALLQKLPRGLHATLRLGPTLSAQVVAGTAANEISALARTLQLAGIPSALPVVTGAGEVAFVVAVTGIPGAGLNLSDRTATGFRWYLLPIHEGGGRIGPTGTFSAFRPLAAGLSAIVVVGYARRGRPDPYEFSVRLPEDVLLDLEQYEFAMNMLELAHPLGVQVDTYALRHEHVDLDDDGEADPLLPAIARTYRPFQRRRLRHPDLQGGS